MNSCTCGDGSKHNRWVELVNLATTLPCFDCRRFDPQWPYGVPHEELSLTRVRLSPHWPCASGSRVWQLHVGPIDILVNNAGIGSSGDPRPLAEFRDEFWDLTLELNLTAPYLLSKAAVPHMRGQRWGRIITVASINSRIPTMHAGAYVASKHGVLGLMRSLALECAADGVTVNCICPGPVRTRMNDARVSYDADRLGRNVEEHERGLTPIGGRLIPEDIAPMAVYLSGDEARMITGQAFNIDGGICMA